MKTFGTVLLTLLAIPFALLFLAYIIGEHEWEQWKENRAAKREGRKPRWVSGMFDGAAHASHIGS